MQVGVSVCSASAFGVSQHPVRPLRVQMFLEASKGQYEKQYIEM